MRLFKNWREDGIPEGCFRNWLDGIYTCLDHAVAQDITGGSAEMFLCSFELDLMTRSAIPQQYLKSFVKCLISLKLAFCRMSPRDRIEMDSENPPFHIKLGIALDFYVLRKMCPRANILHPNCWSLCRNTCDIMISITHICNHFGWTIHNIMMTCSATFL